MTDAPSEQMERIISLSEGNPGAATALSRLAATQDDFESLLENLEEHDMHGPYIWVGFKDHCGQDVERFAQCLREDDEEMLAEVEEYRELRGEA